MRIRIAIFNKFPDGFLRIPFLIDLEKNKFPIEKPFTTLVNS